MKKFRELLLPTGSDRVFLGHCSISPLYKGAAGAIKRFADDLSGDGIVSLPNYFGVMPAFHENMAKLLRTTAKNISYVHNSAEALCLIANGYPFEPGDQVISYVHEYPSNHYPWVLQQRRGVELVLLSDTDPTSQNINFGLPRGWSMEELESKVTSRTRIIAISHVQFSSGFAVDLQELGSFCKARKIDLVVDCAQSLGCLPVYPDEWNIGAVVSSGWKWLLGPKGSAVMFTDETFRGKLKVTMAGPGLMKQGLQYLDHNWNPHQDGRMFEYSTLPWDHVAGLNAVLEDIFLNSSMDGVGAEVIRLTDILLQHIDPSLVTPLVFDNKNRSGILTAFVNQDVGNIVGKLMEKGIVATSPIGYLRLAPHFYQEDEEMILAAQIINGVIASMR